MSGYGELLRQGYEAYARKDTAGIVALLHPEITAYQSTEVPWGGEYSGLAEFAAFMGKLAEHVTTVVEVDEIVEAGDRVVAIGRSVGTVNATGREFEVRAVHVWHMDDGKARRLEVYLDTPAMLAAMKGAE